MKPSKLNYAQRIDAVLLANKSTNKKAADLYNVSARTISRYRTQYNAEQAKKGM